MKTEKIYKVEFMEYTNWMKECVSSDPGHFSGKLLTIGKEPCLVKESDLAVMQKYGGGFRSVTFVGCLCVLETSDHPDSKSVVDHSQTELHVSELGTTINYDGPVLPSTY